MTAAAPPTAGVNAPTVSASYRKYAMTLLLMMYILNFFDRQVIGILAEPIKIDLNLTDTQLGLLTGFAFALLYTFMGIPIARLAEHSSRTKIMSASLAVWSGFTALCGTAANYWQLLLYRVGVGVGEAGGTPPAHSLISDYYPKEKRASALAFYSMGVPIGVLFGYAVGGYISDAFSWRVAFFVAGAPGILLALIAFFTLKETRTKVKADVAKAKAERPPIDVVLKFLFSRKTFWLIAFAAAIKAFIGYGHSPFTASFFLRNHGEAIDSYADGLNNIGLSLFGFSLNYEAVGFIGLAIGLIVGIVGAFSSFMGGKVADWAGKADPGKTMILPAWGALLGGIAYIAAIWVDSAALALFLIGVNYLFNYVWYGPVYAATQSIVPPHMRATAAAILLFIINLIGLGLGPLAVGIMSDISANVILAGSGLDVNACTTAAGEAASTCAYAVGEGIRWALILSTVVAVISFGLFLWASKTLKKDAVS